MKLAAVFWALLAWFGFRLAVNLRKCGATEREEKLLGARRLGCLIACSWCAIGLVLLAVLP